MNLNNQQDNAWSPNEVSQFILITKEKLTKYTPEVWMKWVELQWNGEYLVCMLHRTWDDPCLANA